LPFDDVGEIDGRSVETHVYGLDGARAGGLQDRTQDHRHREGSAKYTQTAPLGRDGLHVNDSKMSTRGIR
jgi:hypothetical protein